jgi:nickel-dependent lactate racemase
MAFFELPYGNSTLPVSIPEVWLGGIAIPRALSPSPDVPLLIVKALNNPIGTAPLSELVKPGQKVAIIVDDYTRKTPVDLLLPPVLEQLLAAGVAPADIRLVVALGTHRPMTRAEIMAKVGAEVADRYEVINTPSTTQSEMVYLGRSSTGIPAWVNRTVAEADMRIGLGMITPHLEAGFTGGAKNILPGVCSSITVDAFHTASAFIPENQLGRLEAPLRRTLEQFVGEQVPLDFIVNAIITLGGEMYECVAGHPIEAHRTGVRYAQTVFGVTFRRRYPIVIANCYPYDFDLWQSAKGVWAGDMLTADDGTLIMLTAAPEGNSNYPLVPDYIGQNPEKLKREIEAGEVEDAKQAATGVMFGHLRQRIKLVLVSDGLTPADARAMGIPYFSSVEEALEVEVKRLPAPERRGVVAVLPQAGVMLPLLP